MAAAGAAAVNGQLTPPVVTSPSAASAQKRKHEELLVAPATQSSTRLQQTQRDLLQVLRPLDTAPSFLNFEFERENPDPPASKKPRVSGDAQHTLSGKLRNAAYTSLRALKEDIAHVSTTLIASIREKSRQGEDGTQNRVSVDTLKQIQRVEAYAKMIDDFLNNESHTGVDHVAEDEVDKLEDTDSASLKTRLNGDTTKREGTVLTLFGNAPTPKQLFSSMPHAVTGVGSKMIKAELPVDEMNLPNGLTATNVLPATIDDEKTEPTFEDTFAPVHSLPTLQPPKPYRSSAKDGNLKWGFRDPVSKANGQGGWTVQTLTVGSWLNYGGLGAGSASSPLERRKQRDRALSSGENTQPPVDKANLTISLAKEEEVLFHRAYSSFAPSHDNSKALIPEETKNMLWWGKLGADRFNETFAIDPALLDEEAAGSNYLRIHGGEGTIDDKELAATVQQLDELDENLPIEPVKTKAEAEDVLAEISRLLETLSSHQRIRNASLPSNPSSRTPISPAPSASRANKTDAPGEDEMAVYNSLRHDLAYLIMKLPPYAVAKLDGDRLGELGVSKLLTFHSKDVRGSLEEDLATRMAKYQASTAAADISGLNRGISSSSQHYSTTAQRTPAIGQAANTRYGQQQYGTSRTPSAASQFQRPSSGASQYNTSPANPPRGGYVAQRDVYTRHAPTTQSYGQQGSQQYHSQRPTPGFGGYGQHYGQAMQHRPNYPPHMAQYQQRPPSGSPHGVNYQAGTYSSGQSPFSHSLSPAKGNDLSQQARPGYQSQHNQSNPYGAQSVSGRSTPNFPPQQPKTPINGYPGHTPPVLPRPPSTTPQTNGHP